MSVDASMLDRDSMNRRLQSTNYPMSGTCDMLTRDTPPYAPTLMESTRAIGYSLSAAIADIIDNSVAARAKNVDVFFYPTGDAYISVLDDGAGMNEAEINTAMQYGSKNPGDVRDSHDLGRYGLGLKTASLSQCRCLTVVSKQRNSIVARRWDLDHVAKSGSWSLLILEEREIASLPGIEELEKLKHGTLVIWQKLDRLLVGEITPKMALSNKMAEVRGHLELVFHRYLAGERGIGKLAIRFNNDVLKPRDPFLSDKITQHMADEILLIGGKKVVVRPYLLPHVSKLSKEEKEQLGGKEGLRRQQGFYVYRNKRLVVWGTWFRMMRQGDMSRLVRIQVDIPNDLDELWTLDIKKSHAIPPAEVRSNLKALIERMAEQSKRTWVYRGKKETSADVVHLWNRYKLADDSFNYEINREHPLVDNLVSSHPEIKRSLDILLRNIERELPLHILYCDLNDDRTLANDLLNTENEIREMIENILKAIPTSSGKLEYIDRIKHASPFDNYPEVVISIRKELGAND